MQEVAESESQDEAKEGETSEETAEGESTEEATEDATVTEEDTATEQEASTGCVGSSSYTSHTWENDWDNELSFNCPSGAITRLMSHHDNRKEDRQWKFGCSSLCTSLSAGIRSGYVNNWDDVEDYTCPANSVMTGMYSVHDNRKEDRRFKFTCSQVVGGHVSVGPWTHDWVNGWDGNMDHTCPSDTVLIGLHSVHDNRKEDRRFKMRCGSVVQAAAPGEIIGEWVEVDWGNQVAKQTKHRWGITTTEGNAVTSGSSHSLATGLSVTTGFEAGGDAFGGKVHGSVTASMEITTTSTMSREYRTSKSHDSSTEVIWNCPSEFIGKGKKWWMYQWVYDVPTWEGANIKYVQVRTNGLMCLGCDDMCEGPIIPQCPPNKCKDTHCQTCHDGSWLVHRRRRSR